MKARKKLAKEARNGIFRTLGIKQRLAAFRTALI